MTAKTRLSLHGISKRFAQVLANQNVSLEVKEGEIHAVLGENGAGKSTLMKIIYGALHPDAGELYWEGQKVVIDSPQMARALGIAIVFQHFSLFDTLTVAENIALGLDRDVNAQQLAADIETTAQNYGLPIRADQYVYQLSVGEQQRVEIVRALLTNPKLLILDEPTSVLTPQAVEALFATLRKLASEGCSIVFISHKLNEIQDLCHIATVMRGGKVVAHCDPQRESTASLSKLMIGVEQAERYVKVHRVMDREIRLEVENLSLSKAHIFAVPLEAISLQVRSGEIVGIAGVSGNGQKELIACLSGEDRRIPKQAVRLLGRPIGKASPSQRRVQGLHFVPEERLGRGAVPLMSLIDNILLTKQRSPFVLYGWIQHDVAQNKAQELITQHSVKASGTNALAKSLSGGNLQKYIVGREMDGDPKVLLISQPTWGVDVGAAEKIYQSIEKLRDQGCAILLISDELDELFALCDRLYVMSGGKLSPSEYTDNITREEVGKWMSGLWPRTGVEAQTQR